VACNVMSPAHVYHCLCVHGGHVWTSVGTAGAAQDHCLVSDLTIQGMIYLSYPGAAL
jgi:hypothetical protein